MHFGKIDFERADAEMCLTLARMLFAILAAMDAQRRRAFETKDSV